MIHRCPVLEADVLSIQLDGLDFARGNAILIPGFYGTRFCPPGDQQSPRRNTVTALSASRHAIRPLSPRFDIYHKYPCTRCNKP
ncbi:unnamed protein product [Pieris macdunnoughi]|uniref:Uncharacterized protein n=1 Tax=Pieris macdunnoughi TaxID=345717 RepID=A0A821VN96_9NEOP|nr:unnamed protein product [Pieris macdunnoughi]